MPTFAKLSCWSGSFTVAIYQRDPRIYPFEPFPNKGLEPHSVFRPVANATYPVTLAHFQEFMWLPEYTYFVIGCWNYTFYPRIHSIAAVRSSGTGLGRNITSIKILFPCPNMIRSDKRTVKSCASEHNSTDFFCYPIMPQILISHQTILHRYFLPYLLPTLLSFFWHSYLSNLSLGTLSSCSQFCASYIIDPLDRIPQHLQCFMPSVTKKIETPWLLL